MAFFNLHIFLPLYHSVIGYNSSLRLKKFMWVKRPPIMKLWPFFALCLKWPVATSGHTSNKQLRHPVRKGFFSHVSS